MTDDVADTNLRNSSFFRGQTCEFTIEMGFLPRRREPAYSDEAGRGFRFEAGRRSEAKPATIPI